MSATNMQYTWLRALATNKKVVTGTYAIRTGTTAHGHIVDNPVDIDDPAADFVMTLGSGYKMGQMVLVVMSGNASSKECTLSITNHETTDPEELFFNAADEYALLCWTGTEWVTVAKTAATSSGT